MYLKMRTHFDEFLRRVDVYNVHYMLYLHCFFISVPTLSDTSRLNTTTAVAVTISI